MSARSARVDVEEIEITRTEKLLAIVLAVFFLIGGLWAYNRVDQFDRSEYRGAESYFTAEERAAVERVTEAQQRLGQAEETVRGTRQDLELAREAYRTALDAGRPAPALEQAYEAAQGDLAAAEAEAKTARSEVTTAQPAADAAYRRAGAEALDDTRQSELATFVLRLALVLGSMAVAYWLLVRLRRRSSRYLPVAFALVGFAAVLALVMAGDYLTDYIDVRGLGPFVLSLAGIALTLASFWWLQRFLARRLPDRRVRKGECPFCGYPARGNAHCEGCGRDVVGECTTCHSPRRVGAQHCGACGAA